MIYYRIMGTKASYVTTGVAPNNVAYGGLSENAVDPQTGAAGHEKPGEKVR